MPFRIIRDDITKVAADAIVNTANPEPVYATGTDRAIYEAAGAEELLAARRRIGRIYRGEAVVTPAFALNAKYIIHTVGPVWQDGSHGEFDVLASCYRKSLWLAGQLGCMSIAFPLISTGVYGFPKDKALKIALEEISAFLDHYYMDVTLVVFDRNAFDLSASLIEDVGQFIDEQYVEDKQKEEYASDSYRRERESFLYGLARRGRAREERVENVSLPDTSVFYEDSMPMLQAPQLPKASKSKSRREGKRETGKSLSDVMNRMGETFQECLLRLIDERGLEDPVVYKRANVDRKLFSKIRCNPYYNPKKSTVLALAVALELNLDETVDLLRRAGLALSPSSKFDLIVEYCIKNRIYDIFEINALLFEYEQPMLGS